MSARGMHSKGRITSRTGFGRVGALALLPFLLFLGCRPDQVTPPPQQGFGGRVIWKVPSGPSPSDDPLNPVANADGSMVYFPTRDYRLKKIRGRDGTPLWDADIGPPADTFWGWNAVLASDVVAIAKIDIFAYDTTTGAHRWTYVAPDFDETGYSSITSDETTVYSASRTARVYALDGGTGKPRWIVDLREGASNVGSLYPTVAGGIVYVCTKNWSGVPIRGTLWALDAANGRVLWLYRFMPEYANQYSGCFGATAIWDSLAIQPQLDGRVFAFDRRTGEVRWIATRVHDLSNGLSDGRFAATNATDVVVTSATGIVVDLDPATGALRWKNTDLPYAPIGFPVVGDSSVYIDYNHMMVAFDLATGKIRWMDPPSVMDPRTQFKGSPIVASDRLYVSGRDGSYAIKK